MTLETAVALGGLLLAVLSAVVTLTVKVTAAMARIEHQLYPNSGSSLRDRVDEVEKQIARITNHLGIPDTPRP